jgi:UDP-glucose 4-epimerase
MTKHTLFGRTLLVTGGAGNIGSFIIDALVAEQPKMIICVDNMFSGKTENIIRHVDKSYWQFYNLDIGDYHSLSYIFHTHKPQYVFHQASMLIQDSETLPHKAIQTNIVGTFNMIQLGNEFGIEKMCYASSASVFGQPKELPVDENHPLAFKDNYLYGATKIANEALMGAHARFDWVGMRYYNVYSERQSTSGFYTQVINYLYERISKGQCLELHSDGSQTVDLIHAEDIAAINLVAMKSEVTGEYFNVGTGVQISVLDLARMLMELMDREVEVCFTTHHTSERMVTRRQSSTKKMKELLSFVPRIQIEEGLRRFVDQRREEKKGSIV